jgi:molecular chaperone GrpE
VSETTDPTGAAPADDPVPGPDELGAEALSVESLIEHLEAVTAERDAASAERDNYLDDTRRLAAEFANFRRQVERRNNEVLEQAAAGLVEQLLPVLDACDGAVAHGATDVEPIQAALLGVLVKGGLERLDPAGEPFDPNTYEAVMHEPGDGGEAVVVEVLRAGYQWNGRVLRPAMVRVRG